MTLWNDASPAPDRALLQRYAADQDEAAFQALVRMHLPLVHAVARRVTGNDELARDVAQETFVRLAQRAALLPQDLPLTAWLHRVTHHLAIDAVRSEDQRRKRERRHVGDPSLHAAMSTPSSPEPGWQVFAPVIDKLVNRLPEKDRRIVLLRYYENQPHAAVARALGLSEMAARKRSLRALEKLRLLLKRQGIATSGAALATMLPGHAATSGALSPVLVNSISVAVKGVTPALPHAFTIHLAMTTAQKSAVAAALVIFLGSLGYAFHRSPELENPALGVAAPSGNEEGNPEAGRRDLRRRHLVTKLPGDPASRLEMLREILRNPLEASRRQDMLDYVALVRRQPELYEETAQNFTKLDVRGPKHIEEFAIILSEWTRLNPSQAVAWQEQDKSRLQFMMKNWALNAWAEADCSAALDWTLNHAANVLGSSSDERGALITVLGHIAKNDPTAALKMLDQVPDENDRTNAMIELAAGMTGGRTDPDAAKLMLEAAKGRPGYDKLLEWSLGFLVRNNHGDAAIDLLMAQAQSANPAQFQNFFATWAGARPDEARNRLESMPAGDLQDQAVKGIVLAQSKDTLPQKLELLDRYPASATDPVLAELLEKRTADEEPLAAERVMQIGERALRDQTLIGNLKLWQRRQPEAAQRWIETHAVSDAVKEAIAGPKS